MYFLPLERGFIGAVLLQAVEVFQEEEPGSLLGVVQFGGATGLFPENVVDVFEGLFEHGHLSYFCLANPQLRRALSLDGAG